MEPKRSPLRRTLRSNSCSFSPRGVALTRELVFEQRSDPIVGRQVLIAEKRAGRPNDFVACELARHSQLSRGQLSRGQLSRGQLSRADCPFCRGHENLTPEPLLEAVGANGQWQVRVVPNKFPVVTLDEKESKQGGPAALDSTQQTPEGAHEVFIESPLHLQDITELSREELALCFRVYRDRMRFWSTNERIRHVSVFKNVGVAAGASLQHIHSQLLALPDVPPFVAEELQAGQRYYAAHRKCVYCQLLADELAHGERIVFSGQQFVAFCAFAGRQPFETWVMPQQHSANFEQLSDEQTVSLAEVLQQLVRRLQAELTSLSYNLILHTAPFGQQNADDFHWHFELVPRSTRLAGFEWGTGMHINPLAPERAASRLRV